MLYVLVVERLVPEGRSFEKSEPVRSSFFRTIQHQGHEYCFACILHAVSSAMETVRRTQKT
jgi:hypothetical protein